MLLLFVIVLITILSSIATVSWAGFVVLGYVGAPLSIMFISIPMIIVSGAAFGVYITEIVTAAIIRTFFN